MGGNAFPNLKLVRLSAKDYIDFENEITSSLRTEFLDIRFYTIPSYREKESFGDCDLLYVPSNDKEVISKFGQCLGAVATVRNGPTTSYAIPWHGQLFQLDMIRESKETVDFARSYFSFNDLGNLIGRIFHRAGFKFGHKGLQFIAREEGNESHVLREITLTTSFRSALEFLGYDYDRWVRGFETLEDIFKFAVSIPLASRTTFRLEETNHAARIRDRKRKTYQLFLLWVQDPKNKVQEHESTSKEELRAWALGKAFEVYPEFKDQFSYWQQVAKKLKEAKLRFNGKLVSEWTGLTGKDLGVFMANFKHQKMGISPTHWILCRSGETIQEEVKEFMGKW